jgi:hypothetical protein
MSNTHTPLLWLGRVAGIGGAAVCAVAIALRVAGYWHVATFAVGTLLQVGMAGMLLACLAYVAAMAARPTRDSAGGSPIGPP